MTTHTVGDAQDVARENNPKPQAPVALPVRAQLTPRANSDVPYSIADFNGVVIVDCMSWELADWLVTAINASGTTITNATPLGQEQIAIAMADTKPPIWFDYTNQAWVIDGYYADCGHDKGAPCWTAKDEIMTGRDPNRFGFCYGREHQGERPAQNIIEQYANVQGQEAAKADIRSELEAQPPITLESLRGGYYDDAESWPEK